jgi:putative Mn2+ efflux pump MntP
VPDHWAPIAVIARQRAWSSWQTARAGFIAGFGHTLTTVLIGSIFWLAGLGAARRFGHEVDYATSAALAAFGLWMAISAWHEARAESSTPPSVQAPEPAARKPSSRTALLLILGSSPSVEALPVFFGAARFGLWFVVLVAFLFAVSTIATYVALSVAARRGLSMLRLAPLERYGEVLSGTVVALLGAIYFVLDFFGKS